MSALLTLVALVAFAGNSLLCRLALRSGAIDPAAFTAIRMLSGAAVLWVISRGTRAPRALGGSWRGALALFAYAAPFSLAYTRLTTGTGALLLFGSVQVTMLTAAVVRGERLSGRHAVGLATAVAGLVTLVWPGVTAPSTEAALLMAAAGLAWGLYSLIGRGSRTPLADTTGNFCRALPFLPLLVLGRSGAAHVTLNGTMLAITSGAVTSAIGYAIWYRALRSLTATQASIVQLAVPVLTAVAGVVLLGELISPRLVMSGVVVLGGVAFALTPVRER